MLDISVTPYKEAWLSKMPKKLNMRMYHPKPADRLSFFTNAHTVLMHCQNFTGLVRECVQLDDEVSRFDLDVSQHSIVSLSGTVDRTAFQLLPTDTPLPNHIPLVVSGDGSCLPRSLSILVFGDEERRLEMRVRLVIELALHEQMCLDHDYLAKGRPDAPDVAGYFAASTLSNM